MRICVDGIGALKYFSRIFADWAWFRLAQMSAAEIASLNRLTESGCVFRVVQRADVGALYPAWPDRVIGSCDDAHVSGRKQFVQLRFFDDHRVDAPRGERGAHLAHRDFYELHRFDGHAFWSSHAFKPTSAIPLSTEIPTVFPMRS